MERDCIIGHGAACCLKERMTEDSDITKIRVCNDCGMIAKRKKNKDVWTCPYCKDDGSGTTKVIVPYAFKTIHQELLTARTLLGLMT